MILPLNLVSEEFRSTQKVTIENTEKIGVFNLKESSNFYLTTYLVQLIFSISIKILFTGRRQSDYTSVNCSLLCYTNSANITLFVIIC